MTSSPSGHPPSSQHVDRRMGARRPPPTDRRMARVAGPGDKRRRLFFIGLALALVVLIGGIGGYGYYQEFVAPTKVLAVRVDDISHDQGDIVSRLRMQQAAAVALGQLFDLGREPLEVVQNLAEAEIIRRAAPGLNIQVTEEDIDVVLRQRFFPRVPEGQEFAPGQLEREYNENYGSFLERSHLSHSEYSSLVEEEIHRSLTRNELGNRIPSDARQVEVQWVKLLSLIDPATINTPGPNPIDVRKRLLDEDFTAVAREVSRNSVYADSSGYVGWVPEGAFPYLDRLLFGTEEDLPLPLGEISEPVHSLEGVFILRVIGGPEERQISDSMREALKDTVLDEWIGEQISLGTAEGWLEVNNSSELYAWVVDQVLKAAPNVTPPAGGQGPDIR